MSTTTSRNLEKNIPKDVYESTIYFEFGDVKNSVLWARVVTLS